MFFVHSLNAVVGIPVVRKLDNLAFWVLSARCWIILFATLCLRMHSGAETMSQSVDISSLFLSLLALSFGVSTRHLSHRCTVLHLEAHHSDNCSSVQVREIKQWQTRLHHLRPSQG